MMQTHRSTSLRNAARVLFAAGAVLACGWAQAQKIDDVPPAVQNNVPPNFMFMIDNSLSMNAIVVAPPYNSSTTYLSCPPGKTIPTGTSISLDVTSSGQPLIQVPGRRGPVSYEHYRSNSGDGRCFDAAAFYAADLQESGGYAGSYKGNYLNWYFGNYDNSARWGNRKPGTESRMEVARRASKAAIDKLPLPGTDGRPVVRAGLSTYRTVGQGNDGGALLRAMADFNTTARSNLKSSIDGLTPQLYTPLASTLADIGRYMATGYSGNIRLQRPVDATVRQVNIDEVFRLDGVDNDARDACLTGASSCKSTSAPKPIQYWCQRSSIFAVTDGRPNRDRAFDDNEWMKDFDGDCSGSLKSQCVTDWRGSVLHDRKKDRTYEQYGSDYMDDVAKLMFTVDLRPDLTKPTPQPGKAAAKNNIVTYMIGFSDEAVLQDKLLENTAKNGGGRFIGAADGGALERAFSQVISDAITLDAAAAAVAVTNAQITSGTVGYASSYVSGSWYGDLEGYSLDINTGLQNGAAQWSARDKLNTLVADHGHAARKIASYAGAGVPFTTDNGTNFRAGTPGLSDALIDYTRGDRSGEPATFRERTYLLGDIVNAEPVVVNYASPGGPVVFQAANDGMLHAFDGRVGPGGGQELWAYVPQLVHGKLAGRASPTFFEHEFLVDSTPVVAEVTGVGSVGRILVGGLGKGGAGYYALDITTGTAADEAAVARKVLWEIKPANMGYSFGTPLIVKTSAGWRVVVASGYRNDSATGGLGGDGRGHVWVIDPADGDVVKEFTTPAGFGDVSDALGLAYLAKPQHLAATAVVRYVYGGDLKGNVWRIDLDAADGAEPVRIAAVTDAGDLAQPITSPPIVAPVTGSVTKLLVSFGTGQYLSVDDVPGTATPNAHASQTQTIYGVVDDTSLASPTLPDIRGSNGASCPTSGPGAGGNGDFVCQQASRSAAGAITVSHNAVDLTSRKGFYLDIPIPGGRVNTQSALTRGGTLVVVVNVPSNITCEPGGSSYLFQLSGSTGGAIVKRFGSSDYFDSVFKIGDALSSRPVIVETAGGPRALLRRSDKDTESLPIDETAGSAPRFRRVYMRPLN